MATLDAEGDRLISMAWAPRTLQTYEVGMSNFRAFRITTGCTNLMTPADAREIIRFIALLSLKKKAPSTITAYVAAISNWHKTNSFEDPCTNFLVKKALKGGARQTACTTLREPITLQLLQELITALKPVCSSAYEYSMLKCAFLLAFFGLFRIGEFVSDTKYRAQRSVIMINDIAVKTGFVKITVRFSKTDQLGEGTAIVLKGQKDSPLCPVEATMEFAKIRGNQPGPLLMHFNGTFLSRYQFNQILAAALRLTRTQVKNVKAHSFRIGGATNAMFKGVPYEKIQEMGRWKSNAAKRYIRQVDINVSTLI